MPARPPTSPHANPFFLLLILLGALFVVTALAYVAGPAIAFGARPARPDRLAGALVALGSWLDRDGPALLAAEFAGMAASALLAIGADPWFTKPWPGRPR